ncbi:MAG: hypothetical protein ACE5H0_01775 [Bacteroidota bacterium]
MNASRVGPPDTRWKRRSSSLEAIPSGKEITDRKRRSRVPIISQHGAVKPEDESPARPLKRR